MTDEAVERVKEQLARWAASHPEIRRCWIFGGVLKGHTHPKDIDIAIELFPELNEGNPTAAWMEKDAHGLSRRKRFEAELHHFCPLPVDLEPYHRDTRCVQVYVAERSSLVYESNG